MKKIFLSLLSAFVVATPLLSRPVLANSAALYLSPASSSITVGNNFDVAVYENSGSDATNAVEANLSYPSNMLDFVSITPGPVFPVEARSTGGNGNVEIDRGAFTPVTGAQLVSTVTFKAKAAGSATVSIDSSSGVYRASTPYDNLVTSRMGGTYTLVGATVTPPPTSPPPTSPPPPSHSPTPKTTNPSSPTKSTAPKTATSPNGSLQISNISAIQSSDGSVVITWTTSAPATTHLDYGTSSQYIAFVDNTSKNTEHTVNLSASVLSPGMTLHYAVKSTDAAGNTAVSADQVYETTGLTVVVSVLTFDGKPADGATVTIGDKSGTTDKDGKVSISGLTSGSQKAVISFKGHKTKVTADVKWASAGSSPQSLTFRVQSQNTIWPLALPAILLVIMVAFYLTKGTWAGLGTLTDRLSPSIAGGPDPSTTVPTESPPDIVTPAPETKVAEKEAPPKAEITKTNIPVAVPTVTPKEQSATVVKPTSKELSDRAKRLARDQQPAKEEEKNKVEPLPKIEKKTAKRLNDPKPLPSNEPVVIHPTEPKKKT